MSAVLQVTKTGPRTYTPVEAILGGQLVEGRDGAAITEIGASGGLVGVAGAGSLRVVGVALIDATTTALATAAAVPVTVNGRQQLAAYPQATAVSVAYSGDEVPVVYAAAASFGQKLIAAANGQVTPAGATPDARSIVGTCTNPGGVAAGATVGLMRIA